MSAAVLDVHGAPFGRRNDRVLPGLGGGEPDRAREGREGPRYVIGESDAAGCCVYFGDVEPRLGEFVGEEPEAGDDRRPAPGLGRELDDVYLQDVAGLGVLDVDAAGDRVDLGEVQSRAVLGGRLGGELASGRVGALQLHSLPGVDLHHRRRRVVPDEGGVL
jgi:hypothetical protein